MFLNKVSSTKWPRPKKIQELFFISLFSYSPCPILQQVYLILQRISQYLLLSFSTANTLTSEHLLRGPLQKPWKGCSCFQSPCNPFATQQPEDLSKIINQMKSLSYLKTFQQFFTWFWINSKMLVPPHGVLPDLPLSHTVFPLTHHTPVTLAILHVSHPLNRLLPESHWTCCPLSRVFS